MTEAEWLLVLDDDDPRFERTSPSEGQPDTDLPELGSIVRFNDLDYRVTSMDSYSFEPGRKYVLKSGRHGLTFHIDLRVRERTTQ